MKTIKEQFIEFFGCFHTTDNQTKKFNDIYLEKILFNFNNKKINIKAQNSGASFRMDNFNEDMKFISILNENGSTYYSNLLEKINQISLKIKLENKLKEKGTKEKKTKI